MMMHSIKRMLIILIIPILIYGEQLNLDANGDGLQDILTYEVKNLQKYPNLDEPTISISIKTKKKKYSFDTYYSAQPVISSCGIACISISQIRGGISGLNVEKHYRFDKKRKHWFLYKSIKDEHIKYFDESFRIDYVLEPTNNLKEFILKCKSRNKKLLNSVSEQYLDYYLEHYSLITKTLTPYNNIAYYLQKAGANEEAVYLLEKILEKFPKRTVAYYNLADAYWALGEKKKAIEAYMTYIEQMCNAGKSKRIPQVVLDRVSTKL